MSDLQIAMRAAKVDCIRATRRFGAFAVLTLRRTIAHSRGHQFVTLFPKASAISLPP